MLNYSHANLFEVSLSPVPLPVLAVDALVTVDLEAVLALLARHSTLARLETEVCQGTSWQH